MRIDPNINAGAIKKYEHNFRQQAQNTESRLTTQTDRIELSKQGLEHASLLKSAQAAADFNAERVAELKEQIRTGQYRPNAEVTSQRLLEQIGLDIIV